MTREEMAPADLRDRFFGYVEKGDGCWLWRGTTQSRSNPYGVVGSGGKQYRAHRLAYFYAFGPIPDGWQVCHACDNPLCVRPDHLSVGTARDNNRDKVLRNRQAKGTSVNTCRLTPEQVQELRGRLADGEPATRLAAEFGIGSSTVYHIKYGHTWRHF